MGGREVGCLRRAGIPAVLVRFRSVPVAASRAVVVVRFAPVASLLRTMLLPWPVASSARVRVLLMSPLPYVSPSFGASCAHAWRRASRAGA